MVGLTASYIGEVFWMFEDHVTFTVGIIQYFIANFFLAIGAVVNLCKERSNARPPPVSKQNMVAISLVVFLIAYNMAQLLVSPSSLNLLRNPRTK